MDKDNFVCISLQVASLHLWMDCGWLTEQRIPDPAQQQFTMGAPCYYWSKERIKDMEKAYAMTLNIRNFMHNEIRGMNYVRNHSNPRVTHGPGLRPAPNETTRQFTLVKK